MNNQIATNSRTESNESGNELVEVTQDQFYAALGGLNCGPTHVTATYPYDTEFRLLSRPYRCVGLVKGGDHVTPAKYYLPTATVTNQTTL